MISEGSPNVSISMGCNPNQVKEFNENLKGRGIPCAHYREDGALITTSNKSRNQMIKAQNGNCGDRQAGYSEYAGE